MRMLKTLFPVLLPVLFLVLIGSAVSAQDPRITVTSDQDEVVVGQPYLLRIEVLVPTFMPSAPVFPTFDRPGLIVRLPERSTTPVSEQIDGDTWSGVRRTYRIYPMQAGVTEIAAQPLSIVYRNTDTNADVPLTVDVPAIQVRATVPTGARTLDPLIIAQDISIEQSWQAGEGELAVGDAVVRSLDISVTGTSALFVPPLLEAVPPRRDRAPSDPGNAQTTQAEAEVANDTAAGNVPFLPYPEDAEVTEKIERGVMSGTRHEQVSYIAQTGGDTLFPDITLRWYNIETDTIEDIVLEGRSFTVAMPPVVRTPPDIATILRWVGLALLAAGLVWLGHRFLWPPIKSYAWRLRRAYDATAHAAHLTAVKRAKAHNLTGLLVALDDRTRRGCPPGAALTQSLGALTQTLYREAPRPGADAGQWRAIQKALRAEKPSLFAQHGTRHNTALPALNPYGEATPQTVYFSTAFKP